MDQAMVAEPVDLVQGLNNTVTVLRAKARAKSATVVVQAEPGLPRARGFGGERNQIWANLIDNALDAIPDSGRVEVTASARIEAWWCALLTDPAFPAGPGADLRPVLHHQAYGTGHWSGPRHRTRRLVRHNGGDISVDSHAGPDAVPGGLPLAEIDAAGASL